MRVSAVARPFAPAPALGGEVRLPQAWGGACPRLPRLRGGADPSLPPLDAGFFFPLPATPTAGVRGIRKFRLRLTYSRRPRPAVRRALGLWGAVSAGRLRVPRPLPPSAAEAGSLLQGPNFPSGLRRTLGPRRVSRPRGRRLRRLRVSRKLRRPHPGYSSDTGGAPALPRGANSLLRVALRPRRKGRGGARPLSPALLGAAPSGAGGWDLRAAPWSRASGAAAPRRRPPQIPPIPQVRYKPGLSRAWRTLRLQFCLAWGLPWVRQRRLTQFITQLRGVTGLGFIQMCLGGLGALVKESGLARAPTLGQGGWVNGRLVRNPFFQLYRGDRVALAPTEGHHPRRDLEWLAFLATSPLGSWEVDGLTRAVTVVADPVPSCRRPLLGRPLPFLTFKMYNWKYRH